MEKGINKLSAVQVKKAQPKEKVQYLSDGGNLYLCIRKSGSKFWEFRYARPSDKKRTKVALGGYPEYSLAEAREQASVYRKQLRTGRDPQIQREAEKAALVESQSRTLEGIAEMWLDTKKESVSAKTYMGHVQKLNKHIYPALGSVPIEQITAPLAIAALRPIEKQGQLETVKRTCAILNNVMTYAVNHGLILHNPLAGIREVFKKPEVTNLASLPPEGLPELMRAMATSNMYLATRCLFEFQLHTMVRPVEAAMARWEEFDFEKAVWTIPAERMKARRPHRVPITAEVLKILEAVKPISGHREVVFPSPRRPKESIDEESLNRALRRAGFVGRQTAHGLRTLASTTINETELFNKDLIESALAHGDEDRIRSIYNRTEWLEQRRKVMSWWSAHIVESSKVAVSVAG